MTEYQQQHFRHQGEMVRMGEPVSEAGGAGREEALESDPVRHGSWQCWPGLDQVWATRLKELLKAGPMRSARSLGSQDRGHLLWSAPLRNLCSGCVEQEPELVINSYLGHRRAGHYQE